MISPGNKAQSGQPFTLIYSLFLKKRNVLTSCFDIQLEIQSKFGVEIALIRLKPEVAQKNDTVC